MSTQAIVVGCGVIGLSTALRLREAGVRAVIRTRARSPHTTSDVAAAVWLPFTVGLGDDPLRIQRTRRSFVAFKELLAVPDAGVSMMQGRILRRSRADELPWWRTAVDTFRRAEASELGEFVDGFIFEAPVITMSTYMPWLLAKYLSSGGVIEDREVTNLDALLEEAPVVVNCTGIDAGALTSDTDLKPVRGQVVTVAPGRVSRFTIVEDPNTRPLTTFVIPRTDCTVMGGTSEPGSWNTDLDAKIAEGIVQRCTALEPSLANAPILGGKAGLRPFRSIVRLEREQRSRGTVVHNYGHGGAGVTLSWPYAEDAARLVQEVL